jgi:hypothetical protein
MRWILRLLLSTHQLKNDITSGAMRSAMFAVAFLCNSAAAEQPTVTFVSACECQGFHGKNRCVTKTYLSPVPLDKSTIQSVTPSQIYQWQGLGPDVELAGTSGERLPAEQKWYALTGRVVDARVKADGDIYLELHDATATTLELSVPKFPLRSVNDQSYWLKQNKEKNQ